MQASSDPTFTKIVKGKNVKKLLREFPHLTLFSITSVNLMFCFLLWEFQTVNLLKIHQCDYLRLQTEIDFFP